MTRAKKISVALGCLLAVGVLAGPAQGAQQIESFTTTSSDTQAGGHPDLSTSFRLADPGAPEAAKSVLFNAPEGVFGNPQALTRCTAADFSLSQCPSDSQAGLITVYADLVDDPDDLLGTAPVYDMVPGKDQTGLFSFVVPTLNIPIAIPVAVRTGGDYGLRFTVSNISQVTPLAGADLIFWGFPADPSNDDERFPKGSPGLPPGCAAIADVGCIASPTPSNLPNRPLVSNPTTCTGAVLPTTLSVQTYQDPANFSEAKGSYPATTACEKETFNPVLFSNLTTNETDSPSGLDLVLKVPQFLGFAASPSPIHSAVVTLPEGLTINPDAADGQSSCSDAQANFGNEDPANCPDNSKIGNFAITTPALDGPLNGGLYIGEPKPGNQYRLFMIADGFGVHAKLVGSFEPDPKTGRLTANFQELPQVPFEEFQIHLFASDRGLMATPTACTIYTVEGDFTPWNNILPPQKSSPTFSLDSGPGKTDCPGPIRPFKPRLVAGTSKPAAGAFSDFTLKLDRDDGDQYLGDLNFKLPPGFTGSLRGISYCPEAAIAVAAVNLGRSERSSPSCPPSSQIGTTNVAAGPGSHPFNATGRMYLSGPFKGAPLSLAAITPALAGPYDYGTVVIRVALQVNPLTAQVSAFSESMPQIIGGIPIRMRSIQVNIDRPDFAINPTNCSAFTVDSQGIGDQGTVTNFSSYFNVVNCSTLPFKPKMSVKQLGKRKDTKRSRNPRLRFDLRTRPGDANIQSLAATLPKAFAIDQRHLANICSRAQLAAERCAGRQPIGNAWVKTPLLDQPLSGPAYAVSGFGKLPRIAFILAGQVTLIPQAESKSVKIGRRKGFLRTTVPVIPDAPIGHFRLTLLGGKKGYLINTRDLCISPARVSVRYRAQNGKRRRQRVKTRTACGKSRLRKAKRHRR